MGHFRSCAPAPEEVLRLLAKLDKRVHGLILSDLSPRTMSAVLSKVSERSRYDLEEDIARASALAPKERERRLVGVALACAAAIEDPVSSP